MLTTYSADESILHVLLNAIRLAPPHLEFHYELSRLIEYSRPVVPRRTLKPHAPHGTGTWENRLPVWHPKVWLARWPKRNALVVSTANLTPADLRTRGNVASIVDVSSRDANRIAAWARARRPPRTLLVDARGRRAEIIITNRSSWAEFAERLAVQGVQREEWLFASPFWSELSVHLNERPTSDLRLTVLGPSREILERALAKVACTALNAFVPARGDFHQKVIAVRQTLRRSTRVVLYVGSANATTSGFFGRSRRGFNWEAGLIRSGGHEVWKLARAMAEVGPSKWKRVVLSRKNVTPLGDAELGPEEEMSQELDAELRTLLFLNLKLGTRSVRLRAPDRDAALELQNPRLLIDDRSVPLGHSARRVTDDARDVVVLGEFLWRRGWRGMGEGTRRPVRLSLPQLLPEPSLEESALTQAQLVRQLVDPEAVDDAGRRPDEELEEGLSQRRVRDVRFPWERLAATEARLGRNSTYVRRWLETVHANPNVPTFWKTTALALLEERS
jgi:hypothetical protein